jgi:hypothetical protein
MFMGGTPQTTGGTPSASSIYSGSYPSSNAFDLNAATLWASGTSPTPHWIAYQFATAVDIGSISWRARADAVPEQNPKDLYIESSDDGVNWTLRAEHTGIATWSLGEERTFVAQQDFSALPRRVSTAGVYAVVTGPPRVSTAGVYVVHGPNERRLSTAGVYVVELDLPPVPGPNKPVISLTSKTTSQVNLRSSVFSHPLLGGGA